jgi:hypothetical protein
MIVVAVMSIVLAIAGGALISLSLTDQRDSAMVTDEQNATTLLAQLSRDIRSTSKITFASFTTPQPANEIQLSINKLTGGTTSVQWIFNATTKTLTRYVKNTSGTFVANSPSLSNVANTASTPIFSYYDKYGDLFTTTGSNPTPSASIAACTTRIGVQIVVAPSGTTGVSNFQVTADVALTDQLSVLTTPGNGQC